MPHPGRRCRTLSDNANIGSARCRQWRSRAGSASLLQRRKRSPRPAGIVASMSEFARVKFHATRRRGRKMGHGRWRCGRGVLPPFLCRQVVRCRPGQSPSAESTPPSKTIKTKGPGLCLRRATTAPNAAPQAEGVSMPPAMAKLSRQWLFCSAERNLRPAGLVASMFEPVRVKSTRPAVARAQRGHLREPALRQGAFASFLSPQERRSPAGGTRPITANRRHATEQNDKDQSPDPGLRRATNRQPAMLCAPSEGPTDTPLAMAKPSRLSPSCSAERSPRPAEIVVSMSEPARASFDATRRPWWSEGTGDSRRCGRAFSSIFLSPQERWSPPGETRPITASQHASRQTIKIKRSRLPAVGRRLQEVAAPTAAPHTAGQAPQRRRISESGRNASDAHLAFGPVGFRASVRRRIFAGGVARERIHQRHPADPLIARVDPPLTHSRKSRDRAFDHSSRLPQGPGLTPLGIRYAEHHGFPAPPDAVPRLSMSRG